jgi:DNA repair protein RadC
MSAPADTSRHRSIAHWDASDRPRERLAAHGAQHLSKAELLAILIGSGTPDESAVALMRRLLADCHDSLNALGKMSLDALCAYKGIGPAKAVTILAACELARRRQSEAVAERKSLTSSAELYAYFHPLMADADVEEFHVLLLNQRLCPIAEKCVARGGITSTIVDVRLVLREALMAHAVAIALCHNHPSGVSRPGPEDDALTERIRRAAKTMDIRLIDHIVLADGNYYSYNDEGKL